MRKISEESASAFWASKPYKNNNTTVFLNRDSENCLQLWGTVVCRFNWEGDLVLNSGGYQTTTTKSRMNAVLMELGMYIRQKQGNWRVYDLIGDSMPYTDGMKIKIGGMR